jgi:Domain of unknown function (DUF4390)
MMGSNARRTHCLAPLGLRLAVVSVLSATLTFVSAFAPKVEAAGIEVISASIAMNLAASASLPRQGSTPNPESITMRSIDPTGAAVDPKPELRPDQRQEGRSDPRADTALVPEGWLLNADVRFSVNARLEDLLEQGVPLYFVTELEAYRPRWYWKDELVLSSSQSVRLSYQAITRQYRVSRGPLSINFSNLSDALRAMGTVRSWRFADGKALAPKSRFEVYVRFRLDKSQLPKPFQLTMITDSDWVPVSEWKHFSFTTDPTRIAP